MLFNNLACDCPTGTWLMPSGQAHSFALWVFFARQQSNSLHSIRSSFYDRQWHLILSLIRYDQYWLNSLLILDIMIQHFPRLLILNLLVSLSSILQRPGQAPACFTEAILVILISSDSTEIVFPLSNHTNSSGLQHDPLYIRAGYNL